MNNIIQYHKIQLQQLYQQSQNIINTQQYQENYQLYIDQQQLYHDLQQCIRQMLYHFLEILQHQYPGYAMSFPYVPSMNPNHLSFRHQDYCENECTDSKEFSSTNAKQYENEELHLNVEDEKDVTASTTRNDDGDQTYSVDECDENQHSEDDRLTIETCYGCIEYYSK